MYHLNMPHVCIILTKVQKITNISKMPLTEVSLFLAPALQNALWSLLSLKLEALLQNKVQ